MLLHVFAPLPFSFGRAFSRCNTSSLRFQLTQQSPRYYARYYVRFQSTQTRKPTAKSTVPTAKSKLARKLAVFRAGAEQGRAKHFLRDRRTTDPNHKNHPRHKLLRSAVATLILGGATYSICAFIDTKFGTPFRSDDAIPDRASDHLPQTWYFTPDTIRQSALALWNDMDGWTLYLGATIVLSALLKKGLWKANLPDAVMLSLFFPSVVHCFDHDGYHTAAFLICLPLAAGYLTEVMAYRLKLTDSLIHSLGPGATAMTAMGFYSVKYSNEKVWAPPGVALRVDAWVWTAGYVAFQAWLMARWGRGTVRIDSLVSCPRIEKWVRS